MKKDLNQIISEIQSILDERGEDLLSVIDEMIEECEE